MKIILHKMMFKIAIVFLYFITITISKGQTTIFLEDFSGLKAGNNIATSGSTTRWNGNEQIPLVSYSYQAGGAIKLGTASTSGSMTTKPLDLSTNGGVFIVQLKVKGWTAVEGNIKVIVNELTEQIVSYTARMGDDFETIMLHFIGGKPNSTITIETTEKRAFIDDMIVFYTEEIKTPQLTSIYPTSINAGSESFSLFVNGVYFIKDVSVVLWNGEARETKFISNNRLEAKIEAKDVYKLADAKITVFTKGNLIFSNEQIFKIKEETLPVLFVSNLEPFGEVCSHSLSQANTFILEGVLLTSSVRINEVNGYLFSTAEDGVYYPSLEIYPSLGTIKSKNIYVKFAPILTQSYNNSIQISGGGATTIEIPVFGMGINNVPIIDSVTSDLITSNNAVITSTIIDEGCSAIIEIGFEYSKINHFEEELGSKVKAVFVAPNIFKSNLKNLEDNTVYYYKNYIITNHGIIYTAQDSLITLQISAPRGLEVSEADETNFTVNWTKIEDAVRYELVISEFSTFDKVINSSDLIISEYVKGSSNNKVIELFNNTGKVVDLSYYSIKKQNNGIGDFKNKLQLSGMLDNNTAYVIVNSKASEELKRYSNLESNSGVFTFTGNDAIALYRNDKQIDIVGVVDQVEDWGKDITLVRKSNVIHPTIEFSFEEWGKLKMDTFNNLGIHVLDRQDAYIAGYENLDIGNITSYIIDDLVTDRDYYYKVRAVGINSTSLYSNSIKVPFKIITPIWNGEVWSNITGPTSTLNAIIDGDYTTMSAPIVAKNLTVKSGELIIKSGTSILLQDAINITEGTVIIEDNGSLLQMNETANTGNLTVQKKSELMLRFDYTSWSSPVKGQSLINFSQETHKDSFYTFNPALGEKQAIVMTDIFALAKGYLIQTPVLWPRQIKTPYLGSFIGVPNNGTITVQLQKQNTNLGYNLIGNPYPSSISAEAFIEFNSEVIDGTLYFWLPNHTMNNDRSYQASNYAKYTRAGATTTKLGGVFPDGIIRTGQGFFVNAITNEAKVTFTNTMRLTASQNPFFMTIDEVLEEYNAVERNRIWLNLTNTDGVFSQILIAYMAGATNGVDKGIDGKDFASENSTIYMVIEKQEYAIQGKPLPFKTTDTIAIGFRALSAGDFTIGLDKVDGIFNGQQPIYIKDKITNTVQNLKDKAYHFSSAKGIFNERFEIVYEKTPIFLTENKIHIYKEEGSLKINVGNDLIRAVAVFDLSGHLIYKKDNINANKTIIKNLTATNQVLILKINTLEHDIIYKKVIY